MENKFAYQPKKNIRLSTSLNTLEALYLWRDEWTNRSQDERDAFALQLLEAAIKTKEAEIGVKDGINFSTGTFYREVERRRQPESNGRSL